jgi:hypothetical protein
MACHQHVRRDRQSRSTSERTPDSILHRSSTHCAHHLCHALGNAQARCRVEARDPRSAGERRSWDPDIAGRYLAVDEMVGALAARRHPHSGGPRPRRRDRAAVCSTDSSSGDALSRDSGERQQGLLSSGPQCRTHHPWSSGRNLALHRCRSNHRG